jgi:hypothetical protein
VKGVSVILWKNSDVPLLLKILDKASKSLVLRTEVLSGSNEVRIVSNDPFRLVSELSDSLKVEKLEAESVSVTSPSLEEVIVRLVGEKQGIV